ncbi:MAG: serine protease, partial [Patescibacteria group bacterium]
AALTRPCAALTRPCAALTQPCVFVALALLCGCGEFVAVGNVVPNAKTRLFWERLVAYTVRVSVADGSWGSGVLIPGGKVLTAEHIIEKFKTASVYRTKLQPDGSIRDGTWYPAEVLDTDKRRDLALLALRHPSPDLPAAPIGNSAKLSVGEIVYRLGRGPDVWMTYGRITSLEVYKKDTRTRLFAIATLGGAGSSGGPVFTRDGRLVGISVMAGCIPFTFFRCRYPDYAVPVNYAYEKLLHR